MKNILIVLVLASFSFGCKTIEKSQGRLEAAADAEAKALAADAEKEAREAVKVDLVSTLTTRGQFTTFLTAVGTADLISVLQGEGPYTVFAPTDEAFANLPEGTVERLLDAENREELINVLKFHIVPGNFSAERIESGEYETLAGVEATIVAGEEGVAYSNAQVTSTDIEATNGVIHVISTVALPQ